MARVITQHVDGHCHGNMMVRHCATRLVCIAVVGQPELSTSRNHGDNKVYLCLFFPLNGGLLFLLTAQASLPIPPGLSFSVSFLSFSLCGLYDIFEELQGPHDVFVLRKESMEKRRADLISCG